MREEYRKINEFECCGKVMVIVRKSNSCHVMTMKEWRKVYGRNHPERWENGVRVKKKQRTV